MKLPRLFITVPFAILFVSFLVLQRSDRFQIQAGQNTTEVARGNPAIQESASQSDPPGIIDGAKNPELIPDEVAYGLVFQAFAESPNARTDEMDRAFAKIRLIGLSEDEAGTFFRAVSSFRVTIESLDAQATEIQGLAASANLQNTPLRASSNEGQELELLSTTRSNLIFKTIQDLENALTGQGMEKVRVFVQREKAHMRYLP